MYNLVEGCLYSKTLNLASVESRSILRRGAGGYKGDQDIVLDLKELVPHLLDCKLQVESLVMFTE